METRRVTLAFHGGPWASLGMTMLNVLLTLCVIPAAWGTTALTRWWSGCVTAADGGRLGFEGRASRVWGLFAASVVLDLLPQIASGRAPGNRAFAMGLAATVVLLPLTALVKLQVTRWIVANLRLDPGGNPHLTASYGAYLGWLLILNASILTVVGWAWVLVAMARWLCGHVRGDGFTADFTGTGFGLLWRSLVWCLGSLLLIPIPWVLRSVYAWFTGHLVLVRQDGPE